MYRNLYIRNIQSHPFFVPLIDGRTSLCIPAKMTVNAQKERGHIDWNHMEEAELRGRVEITETKFSRELCAVQV